MSINYEIKKNDISFKSLIFQFFFLIFIYIVCTFLPDMDKVYKFVMCCSDVLYRVGEYIKNIYQRTLSCGMNFTYFQFLA